MDETIRGETMKMDDIRKSLKRAVKKTKRFFRKVRREIEEPSNPVTEYIVWFFTRYATQIACIVLTLVLTLTFTNSRHAREIEEVRAEYEARIEAIAQTQEKEATEGQRITMQRALTENLARVLQGVDRYDLTKPQKLAYLQILRNRANPEIQYDVMRGTNDLDSVLQIPKQFETFEYGTGYYSKDNYKIAEEFLASDTDYLNSDRYFWCRIGYGSFVAMDSFDGNGSNQKVG